MSFALSCLGRMHSVFGKLYLDTSLSESGMFNYKAVGSKLVPVVPCLFVILFVASYSMRGL